MLPIELITYEAPERIFISRGLMIRIMDVTAIMSMLIAGGSMIYWFSGASMQARTVTEIIRFAQKMSVTSSLIVVILKSLHI